MLRACLLRFALAVALASVSRVSCIVMHAELAQKYSCDPGVQFSEVGFTVTLPPKADTGPKWNHVAAVAILIAALTLLFFLMYAYSRCVERPGSTFWQCCRSIPYWQCLALGMSVVGVAAGIQALDLVLKAIELLFAHANNKAKIMSMASLVSFLFGLSLVGVVCLNVLCTVYGFLGTGCCKERVFGFSGGAQAYKRYLMRALQCLIGPVFIRFIRICLWASVAGQIMLPMVFGYFFFILKLLNSMCGKAGTSALSAVNMLMPKVGFPLIPSSAIKTYCLSSDGAATAGAMLVGCCLINLYTQVMMLTGLAQEQAAMDNEWTAMEKKMALKEKAEKEHAAMDAAKAAALGAAAADGMSFPPPRSAGSLQEKRTPAESAELASAAAKHPAANAKGFVKPAHDPFFVYGHPAEAPSGAQNSSRPGAKAGTGNTTPTADSDENFYV